MVLRYEYTATKKSDTQTLWRHRCRDDAKVWFADGATKADDDDDDDDEDDTTVSGVFAGFGLTETEAMGDAASQTEPDTMTLILQSAMKCTNVTGKAPRLIGSPSMWPSHHSWSSSPSTTITSPSENVSSSGLSAMQL